MESELEAVSPPCPSSPPPPIIDWSADLQPLTLQVSQALRPAPLPPPPIIDWSADLQPLTLQVRRSLSSHTLLHSVADPGSGAFLTPGSGMNNPDHIF
jgi:hypothetical protein